MRKECLETGSDVMLADYKCLLLLDFTFVGDMGSVVEGGAWRFFIFVLLICGVGEEIKYSYHVTRICTV